MGTIPGPVIECNVENRVLIHFRNQDFRAANIFPLQRRTHSLHPHGFVFNQVHDGAYPLSPPDRSQPIDLNSARLDPNSAELKH